MGFKPQSPKNIYVTYFLWLFFGIFGGHHFYLERDVQAFLWWCTLGGFGCGWIRDLFCIPRYVAEANNDPEYLKEIIKVIKSNRTVSLKNIFMLTLLN